MINSNQQTIKSSPGTLKIKEDIASQNNWSTMRNTITPNALFSSSLATLTKIQPMSKRRLVIKTESIGLKGKENYSTARLPLKDFDKPFSFKLPGQIYKQQEEQSGQGSSRQRYLPSSQSERILKLADSYKVSRPHRRIKVSIPEEKNSN